MFTKVCFLSNMKSKIFYLKLKAHLSLSFSFCFWVVEYLAAVRAKAVTGSSKVIAVISYPPSLLRKQIKVS